MKSSKIIDVSKASLVSLKAELSRKQEEVNRAKTEAQASFIHPIPRKKKEQEQLKKETVEKDVEQIKEDEELHRKSRNALEAKERLYEKLSQPSSTHNDTESEYLVDFERKVLENKSTENNGKSGEKDRDDDNSPHNSDEYGTASDSEEEWVDYTDCLGRTRRCLKCDLDFVKDKDIQLATTLGFCVDNTDDKEKGKKEISGPLNPDLMSNDMRREQLRQKWEQQEELLKDKKDIHYQDVLFDEARTHGVGYFAFAQDEDTRRQQQEALSRLREDTRRQQVAAKEVRRRRQAALSARVRAAKNRQRARLGLPPEPAPEPHEEADDNDSKETEEETKKMQMEADKQDKEHEILKKSQTMRPWDIGKEKRKPFQEMSQEEWVKKKRQERNDEFAPPQMYREDIERTGSLSSTRSHSPCISERRSPEIGIGPLPLMHKSKSLFFSSKQEGAHSSKLGSSIVSFSGGVCVDVSKPPPSVNKAFLYSRENASEETTCKNVTQPQYKKIVNEVTNPIEISSDEESEEQPRGRGVEIAPPPTSEYYGLPPIPVGRKGQQVPQSQMSEIEKSISVGLKFLRKQQEEKDKKRDKGLLDII